jgi:hypothetical protein
VAGLELTESFPLCHHAAWRTHLRDVIIVIHGDLKRHKERMVILRNGYFGELF